MYPASTTLPTNLTRTRRVDPDTQSWRKPMLAAMVGQLAPEPVSQLIWPGGDRPPRRKLEKDG